MSTPVELDVDVVPSVLDVDVNFESESWASVSVEPSAIRSAAATSRLSSRSLTGSERCLTKLAL